jgi:hypothetical protein
MDAAGSSGKAYLRTVYDYMVGIVMIVSLMMCVCMAVRMPMTSRLMRIDSMDLICDSMSSVGVGYLSLRVVVPQDAEPRQSQSKQEHHAKDNTAETSQGVTPQSACCHELLLIPRAIRIRVVKTTRFEIPLSRGGMYSIPGPQRI